MADRSGHRKDLTIAEAVSSDLVICDYCSQVFVKPLLLPCLHTFCQKCVVALATENYNLKSTRSTKISTSGRNSGQVLTKTPKNCTQQLKLLCPICQATVTLMGPSANGTTTLLHDPDEDSDDTVKANDRSEANGDHESRDGDPCHRQRKTIARKKKRPESPNDTSQPAMVNKQEAVGSHEEKDEQDPGKTKHMTNHKTEEKNCSEPQVQENEIVSKSRPTTKQTNVIRRTVQESLPINHFLDSLARLHHHRNDSGRLCAYCKTEGTDVEAVCLCLQCQDNMCETCASAHRKTRITREHQVAAFEAIRQGLFDHDIREATGTIPCQDHPHSSTTHFCTNCLVVACMQCRSKNHYGHKLLTLAEASNKFLPEMERFDEALVRSCPPMSQYAQFLNQQIERLTAAKEAAAAEVNLQAKIIIEKIEERRRQICSKLEEEYDAEKSNIHAKITDVRTSEHSTIKSANFLHHLGNLGRADEKMYLYVYVLSRYKELLASRQEMVTSKLSLNFYPGPNINTNVGILVGTLEAKRIPVEGQDAPKKSLILSSLMPSTLSPPQLLATISASTSKTMYPSGLDIRDNMLAVVDRENQKVQIFDFKAKRLVKEFSGGVRADTKQEHKFKKPFDLAFLPNGVLAITDPEASCVSMYEWTGKFITDFKGDIRHPRGIMLNKAGQVVVVDGHLRCLSIHDPSTGEKLKTIQPYREEKELKSNGVMLENEAQTNKKELQQTSHDQVKMSSLFPPVLVDPFYIHITEQDNIVISDAASPNLKILDPNGKVLAETMDYGTGPNQNLHPSGICIDKYGYIFIADTNNNRIHLGLPDGQIVEPSLLSSSDGLSHPVSLCLTQEGHLVVGQSGGQIKLYKYIM